PKTAAAGAAWPIPGAEPTRAGKACSRISPSRPKRWSISKPTAATDHQKREPNMKSSIRFCAMPLAATGLFLAPAVNAQTQTTPPTTKPDRPAPAADISEQKLEAAAKAVKNVSTIRDSYEQKLI